MHKAEYTCESAVADRAHIEMRVCLYPDRGVHAIGAYNHKGVTVMQPIICVKSA